MASNALLASGFLPHALSGSGGLLFAVLLGLVALGLMFAGRSIIKGLAFLVVGLAGAAAGLAIGGSFLGPIGALLGGVTGFIVGGLVGVFLVEVGMGAALGYFGYLAVRYLVNSFSLAVVAGIVLFIVGLVLAGRLLELVTAAIGGVVLYGVLVFFGLAALPAAAVSLILAVVGFYSQRSRRQRPERQWRT